MNHILIAGHLGADPEVRFTNGGQKVTTLRLACNSRKSGKEETMWWRVTIWGEQFDRLMPHLKKGSSLIVTGEMSKPEIYTDREGKPQLSLNMTASNIQFSPFGRTERTEGAPQAQAQTQAQAPAGATPGMGMGGMGNAQQNQAIGGAPAYTGGETSSFSEDEIPF